MRISAGKSSIVIPVISILICGCLAAEMNEYQSGPTLINNIFTDTDLRQAIQDIAAQAQKVVVLDESVEGIVTCELQGVSFEKALDIVLAGTSFMARKMSDYYLVCSVDPKSRSFPLISETRLVRMNYVTAGTAIKLLSDRLRDYVRAEGQMVCVTAPPQLMNRILADLEKFDSPPRHVLLDVRIVVLERMDLLDIGIEWSWPQVQAGGFSDAVQHSGGGKPDWLWGMQIGYTPDREFTNALMTKLNLLSQKDKATVVANPQVLAQDNEEAEIKVLTEEYFKIVSEGYYARLDLEKIETGTILTIKPRITDTGQITLQIGAEVSDVIARGEDNLPVVTRRTAKSTVRVEDGGTAAIAGLVDNRTRLGNSKTPGLSEIPLLGNLFKNSSDQNVSRQVAVFVTAHLMLPGHTDLGRAFGSIRPSDSDRASDKDFLKIIEDSLLDSKE